MLDDDNVREFPGKPEEPEDPAPGGATAHDGEPNGGNGTSVADAASEDNMVDEEESPLAASRQLSLAGLGFKGPGKKPALETEIAMTQAARPSRGLYGPDEEVVLVVKGYPAKNEEAYTREDSRVRTVKVRQHIRPDSIGTVAERWDLVLGELATAFADHPRVTDSVEILQGAIEQAQEVAEAA